MKLNVKKTIYVGLAFLIICMFWQVYDNIIAKMLINSFGFNQTLSGIVLALDNVLALFLLPLFGTISDKTKTKYGKRTPFIVIGVIVSAILFIGVAFADTLQQNAVNTQNIPHVEEILDEDEEVIGYSYGDQEFFNEDDIVVAKNEANEARRATVWEVTKDNLGYLILFIGILFIVLLVMATYRTPAVSLMPDVTPKPLRSKANAIINLMGTVGAMTALVFMQFLAKDYESYVLTFIVLAAFMIVLLFIFIRKVKEPKLLMEMKEQSKLYGIEEEVTEDDKKEKMSPAVRRSFLLILLSVVFWFMAYNAATSKFSVYAGNILNMGFALPLLFAQGFAVASYIPIGIIASKVGRKKTILVGVLLLLTAFLLGTIATENTKFLIYITMGVAGIAWATINVNSYPMIVEMSKGSNIGKYTGYYYTASMAAQIVTPILSGVIMDYVFNDMRALFPYSVFFCILAFISMSFVKHGDSKPIPKSKVEAFAEEE